jgi:putative hydrolase of the HAD superfamily
MEPSGMTAAILFDIGGPIDTEVEHERLMDADIRDCLAQAGIAVDDASYREAERRAIESFAPNAYQSIVWQLTSGEPDRAARVWAAVQERSRDRDGFRLRPGIAVLLAALSAQGLLIGLAANQPAAVLEKLDRAGIGRYFGYREVSGTLGLRKPDPRLLLKVCEGLGVSPARSIMVGDRIDNDVVPARILGMRTIRFRTGRHTGQQPRSWLEVPDEDVSDVESLADALQRLIHAMGAG